MRAALDRLSAVLARSAAAFVRLRAWTLFGFARVEDLARERYGRSGRWLRDLATLGEGVAASPELAAALTGRDGSCPLGRVAATLVARATSGGLSPAQPHASLPPPRTAAGASPQRPMPSGPSVSEWIALARRSSVRDLREALRQARTAAEGAGASAAPGPTGVSAGLGARHADPPPQPDPQPDETDPDADRCLLRLPVPEPLLSAFEEALDLHRAVQGRGTSVSDFIEALVGEAHAGGLDVGDGFLTSLRSGLPEAQVEAAIRRASGAWSALPEPGPQDADPLSRFAALEARAGEGDAVELDAQIRALVRLENQLEAELGLLLSGMTERREWSRLQFAGAGHYAEERLGMSRSRASARMHLARALRSLPAVAAACADDRIPMESAALIRRILGSADARDHAAARPEPDGAGGPGSDDDADRPRLEAAWVEHASITTIKRMRDEARALGRYRVLSRLETVAAGSSTSDDGHPGPVSPVGRAEAGHSDRPMSDEEWSAALRREVGTATRRIRAFGFLAAGITPPADPDVFHRPVSAADPDGFHRPGSAPDPDVFHRMLPEPDACLRLRLPADLAGAFLSAIEAARLAVEQQAAAVPWDEPWPAPEPGPRVGVHPGAGDGPERAEPASAWAARMAFVRGRRVPRWVGLLALLEDFAATWDSDGAAPDRQDDSVFIRDGWRCAAPGCSSRRNLEIHHVVYRSRGGSDDAWNLVTLCRFHHQCGEHGGLLCVRGRAPLHLTWRLGRADLAVAYRADVARDGAGTPGDAAME